MGGHVLRAALATAVAVAGLLVVPAHSASAVSAGRPTAIAVTSTGTTYVGFANADGLLVLAPDGSPRGSIALEDVGPVTGVAVDPDGRVWVDDGSQVVRIGADGTVAARFRHGPADGCAADAGRYGGLAVTATRVYVAERCSDAVTAFTRGGSRLVTLDLPGTGRPSGIALAPAYKTVPARLYVSVPDAGKVYVFNASGLGNRSKPVATVTHGRPGGLAVDDHGHLAVLDAASNGLYLYDARKRYQLYRTLGHPPTAAATKGYLSRPAAVVQGGAKVGRHFWIADTGNGRVQRWNPAGTTQWMADTRPPSAPGTPVNTSEPTVTGTPELDAVLTCTDGAWTGSPTSYARAWLRDDEPIDGADGRTYAVTADDVGAEISCVVTATNAAGASAPAASEPVEVTDGEPEPPPAPVTTCRGEPSVRIQADGRVVRRPFVTLKIRAPEGADEVLISNDGFKTADRKPLVEGCLYAWTLDNGPSSRPKVVSVRFPGVTGVVRDQILLDGGPPVIRRVTAKWITRRQGWVLNVRATDRGTGIASVRVGKTRATARTYAWPADIVSWDSTQLRWIQVVDRVGYRSTWYRLRLR